MRIAIVGGGIAGLAAAHTALTRGHEPLVFEADDQWGGKIRTSAVGGIPVDEGADAFLARVPHAVGLARDLGLGDELVSPGTGQASVYVDGRLRTIPGGLVLGVPADLGPITSSDILTVKGRALVQLDRYLPRNKVGTDESVGRLVAQRFGAEVRDRLADPLIGGINVGRADQLSAAVVAPNLLAAAREHRSLSAGLRAMQERTPAATGPVFHSLRGGTGRLVEALVASLGKRVLPGHAVEIIEPGSEAPWRVATNDAEIEADAVVVATPAFAAAPLLQAMAPAAAAHLASVQYASVTLATLVLPEGTRVPDGSGFLVPRTEGRLLTAATFFTTKWPHLETDGRVVVRLSSGRVDDVRHLDLDDDDLVERLRIDLHEIAGVSSPPEATRVVRWPRSFPQFAVGHLARVAAAQRSLPVGVAWAGSHLRGVGIPTTIATAKDAIELLEAGEGEGGGRHP